ncbi:MAG: hypothetical protein JKY54_13320 [Flavobacteriales bacterium]|nr:hypothetical protein [Flavobacteriales bacterium]
MKTNHLAPNFLILSTLLILILGPIQSQGELKNQSIPNNAKASLSTSKSNFLLGENILVHFKLENTGGNSFKANFGGDYRAAARSLRWKVTAINEKGDTVADPYPEGFCMGGLGYETEITKDEPYYRSIPILRYLRFEKPGTYRLKIHHDFGWKSYSETEFPDAEMELVIKEPTEKEARKLVKAWILEKEDPGYSVGEKRNDFPAFSFIRCSTYLPALLEEATNGSEKAVWGIGSIATVKATASLIDLIGSENDTIVEAACRELCSRLPDPYLKGELGLRNIFDNDRAASRKYLVQRSWDDKFTNEIKAIAAIFLNTNDKDWIATGAFLMECVGEIDDIQLITEVLTTEVAKSYELRTDIYPRPRGACMELQRAAKILLLRGAEPDLHPKTAGESILYLIKIASDSSFRPADMAETCLGLLTNGVPYVQEHVLKNYPAPLDASTHKGLVKILASNNVDARIQGVHVISRDSLVDLKDVALNVLKTAKEDWLFRGAENAVLKIGSDYERIEILVSRIDEEDMLFKVLDALKSIFSNTGGGGQDTNIDHAATAKKIKPLWEDFIIVHKEALKAGKKFTLPCDEVSEGMFPEGYYMSLEAGEYWPKPDWED